MVDDLAISVKGLGKRYRIGEKKASYNTFRDTITMAAKAPFKRMASGYTPPQINEFWALKDISFNVGKGEIIGIIGRNGAGKSTLLKILSRITEPTLGRAELYGRVGSLLEVGTGFHPELTGKENIFLSGAILGMRKAEIESRFDDIIRFAETEKFLETPLKHYSSGMQVRLGFAVAAHLEPEILIVDEVLAVGDAEFQKKCLGKMSSVAKEGRTVLFVSHNMAAVQGLCQRCIFLQNGKLVYDDEVNKTIEFYLNSIKETNIKPLKERMDRPGTGKIRAIDVKIFNQDNVETNHIPMGEDFSVQVTTKGSLKKSIIGILIGNVYRAQLIRGYTWENVAKDINLDNSNIIKCKFNKFPLMHGTYDVHIWLGELGDMADYVENASIIHIEPQDVYGTGRLPDTTGGIAFCRVNWEMDGKPI